MLIYIILNLKLNEHVCLTLIMKECYILHEITNNATTTITPQFTLQPVKYIYSSFKRANIYKISTLYKNREQNIY